MLNSKEASGSIFRISVLAVAVLGLILFAGTLPRSGGVFVAILVGCLFTTVGAIVGLVRCSLHADAGRAKSEGVAAALVIFGLGISVGALTVDRMLYVGSVEGAAASLRDRRGFPNMPPSAMGPRPPSQSPPIEGPGPNDDHGKRLKTQTADPNTAAQNASEQEDHRHDVPDALAKELDQLLEKSQAALKSKNYDEADTHFSKILSTIDEKLPGDLERRGKVIGQMAGARFSSGKVKEALQLVEDQLAKMEASQSENPAAVADFVDLAGTYLGNLEMYKESIDRFRKSLALKESAQSDPLSIVSTRAKIAISLARLGSKEKAGKELEIAREILKRSVPDDKQSLERLDKIAAEYNL